MSQTRLKTLLKLIRNDISTKRIEYNGFLSNHLHHLLIADYKLGASTARMEKDAKDYSNRLETVEKTIEEVNVTRENWRALIGARKDFEPLRAFFAKEYARVDENVPSLLREYLPSLLDGAAGSAFHGTIELGYSLEMDNADLRRALIPVGLAYLTFGAYSVGHPSEKQLKSLPLCTDQFAFADLLRVFVRVAEKHDELKHLYLPKAGEGTRYQDRLLRMEKVRREASKDPLGSFVRLPPTTTMSAQNAFSLLNHVLLALYASTVSTRDFFILHVLTCMRALRTILRNCDSEMQENLAWVVLQRVWDAAIVVFLTRDCPKLDLKDVEYNSNEKWTIGEEEKKRLIDETVQSAFEAEDEHVKKLAFTILSDIEDRDQMDDQWSLRLIHRVTHEVSSGQMSFF